MIDVPFSQAAWGWTLAVPPNLGFNCTETPVTNGAFGCPDPSHGLGNGQDPPAGKCETGQKTPCCKNSTFVCTVKADAGYSCDKATTKIVCSTMDQSASNANKFTNEQPTMPVLCINTNGMGAGTKTADLSWHDPPTCTKSTTASPVSQTSKSFLAGPQACLILFLGAAATVRADFLA